LVLGLGERDGVALLVAVGTRVGTTSVRRAASLARRIAIGLFDAISRAISIAYCNS
jgi:hypothetical protein